MSLIKKFLQVLLCLSLIALVLCFTSVNVFKSNEQLTYTLDKAKFYSAAARIIASQINSQIIGDEKEVNFAKQSIEQGISAELVRITFQPIQIALISWLTNERDDLKLNLDMQAIKTKVENSIDSSELKFLLTKLIPDNLELTDTKNNQFIDFDSLKRVKAFYAATEDSIPILGVAICGLSGLLFILNIHRGSKKLTSFLLPSTIASIIGLFLVGLSYLIEGMISTSNSTSHRGLSLDLSIRILTAIIQQALWYYVAIGIISLSGIIIAKRIFKKRDNKLKDRKK
jgi:Na+-transporting NADH:ubiquinone oxidoreductase subunit NqrC